MNDVPWKSILKGSYHLMPELFVVVALAYQGEPNSDGGGLIDVSQPLIFVAKIVDGELRNSVGAPLVGMPLGWISLEEYAACVGTRMLNRLDVRARVFDD